MSADIIDLRPILLREFPDPLAAQRDADRALHFAIQRHKVAYGEEITALKLKQVAAGIEYFRGIENEAHSATAGLD